MTAIAPRSRLVVGETLFETTLAPPLQARLRLAADIYKMAVTGCSFGRRPEL